MSGSKRNFLAILIILSPFTSVSALAMPILHNLDFPTESTNIKTENSKNSNVEFKQTDVKKSK